MSLLERLGAGHLDDAQFARLWTDSRSRAAVPPSAPRRLRRVPRPRFDRFSDAWLVDFATTLRARGRRGVSRRAPRGAAGADRAPARSPRTAGPRHRLPEGGARRHQRRTRTSAAGSPSRPRPASSPASASARWCRSAARAARLRRPHVASARFTAAADRPAIEELTRGRRIQRRRRRSCLSDVDAVLSRPTVPKPQRARRHDAARARRRHA